MSVFLFGLLAAPLCSQDRTASQTSSSEDAPAAFEGKEEAEKEDAEAVQMAEDLPKTPWSLTLYGAFHTTEKVGWAFLPPTDLEGGYGLVAGAVSYRVTTIAERADVEIEGQIVKHFGSGSAELNALVIGRWIRFPWNDKLRTTVALGVGFSRATSIPAFEALTHETTAQLLTYVMFEGTLTHPDSRHWAFAYRIHHRSGFFGAFNGVRGASNALGFGVKYQW